MRDPDPSAPVPFRGRDPATGTPVATPTLWTVQGLRALAALMVVVGHSQSAVAGIAAGAGRPFHRSLLLPWGAGVDLFFVISGFIMIHASRDLFGRPDGRRRFLERRLARIVPLYWGVTVAYLAILALAAAHSGAALPGGARITAAFLFVPVDTFGDGRIMPVFDLGWTLNYEVMFYGLFALYVGLPRRRCLAAVLFALSLLVGLGSVTPADAGPLAFWTRPIVLDFALGAGVGALAARHQTLSPVLRWAAVVLGVAVLAGDPTGLFSRGGTVANGWPRVFWAGLPATLMLAGAVLGPQPRLPSPIRPLVLLGNASYSLYLLHPFALIVLGKLAQKLPGVRVAPGGLLVGATVLAAVALAGLVFVHAERPVTAALNRWLRDGRGGRAAPRLVGEAG